MSRSAVSPALMLRSESLRLPLAANFGWSLAGTLGSAAAQWGVIAVLARMGSATVVGAYSLALAIAAPVFLFSSLHLRALQSTDVQEEFTLGTYLALRAFTTSLAIVTVLVVASYAGGPTGWALAGLALGKAFESVSDAVYGNLQRSERMDRIGRSMLWRGAATFLAMLLSMSAGIGMLPGIWIAALFSGFVALVDLHDALDSWNSAARPQWGRIRSLARRAAPLGLFLLLISLNANVPRYFLAKSFSMREVGILAALGYLAIAANTLVMAMGQAALPSLARAFAHREVSPFVQRAALLLSISVGLGLACILSSVLAGGAVLSLLYGPEFASEARSFQWLMASGAVSYLAAATGYLLSSARCFEPQLPIMLGVLGLTTLCCYLSVPAGGLIAAAKAQTAGYLLQFSLSASVLISCCWTQFRSHHA